MWDLLKQTDIEQAKQGLQLRRAETLRRHAEESQILDAGRAELETLHDLVDVFVQKFMKSTTSLQEPVAAPVSYKNVGDKTYPKAIDRNHRDYPRTNFAVFARAVARG